jgi:hypothetical protein
VSTDDKELIDEGLRALSGEEARAEAAEHAALEELAQRVEEPGIQDKILDRYMSFGRDLLADQLPSHLDPRIIKQLKPILGDVSGVKVHTGATATAAARAMDARAFALGNSDIFIDTQQFDPSSREGSALIAHEIAHARDASTGFALSSKHGGQTSDREAFAEAVESRVFAMEDDSLEGAANNDTSVIVPNDPTNTVEPTLDKEALSRRVWEILEEQQRSARDRHGR